MKITKELVDKIDTLLEKGLTRGLGKPNPGEMCVEALICNVLGLEHSDDPKCVNRCIMSLKIRLNDSNWSSNIARAHGMRNLAILQLGTLEDFNESEFINKVITFTCKDFIVYFLTEMKYDWFTQELKKEIDLSITFSEMKNVMRKVKHAAYAAADSAADSADAAADASYADSAADSAAYAADAAADASYAADAAADASYAAPYAAACAADAADACAADAADADADASYAAPYAAACAADACAADAADAADKYLIYFAKGVEKILIEMNVPGKEFI